ncbi:MAG: phosphotransferase, partial [Ornithinimicrobium sp.]
ARPAPADAPANRFRGVPLADRHVGVMARIEGTLAERLRPRAHAVWAQAMATAPYRGEPVWLHGDLHPANLLVDRGSLAAVIDWGDLTAGDPATDLSVAWMMFADAEREIFRSAAGDCDDATWVRARGNALAHALACLSSSSDDAVIAALGSRTLDLVLDDAEGREPGRPRAHA